MTKISLLNLVFDDSDIATTWNADLVADGLPIGAVACNGAGRIEILEFEEGITSVELFELDDFIFQESLECTSNCKARPTTLFELCQETVALEIARKKQIAAGMLTFEHTGNQPFCIENMIDVILVDGDDLGGDYGFSCYRR